MCALYKFSLLLSLKSNHLEADKRMILHATFATQQSPAATIVVQAPETHVFIPCIALFTNISCEELWFPTGVRDHWHHIPLHTIQSSLGEICQSLPALHALSGCDSMSSIAGIKKKPWKALKQSKVHQTTLGFFGRKQDMIQCYPQSYLRCISSVYIGILLEKLT